MSVLFDSTVKVSLIVLVALGANVLLRRRSAALRHWVLAVAIACAAAAPLVGLVAPAWHVGLDTFASQPPIARPESVVTTTTVVSAPAVAANEDNARAAGAGGVSSIGRVLRAVAAPIWLTGMTVSLLMLLAGMARLARVASHARRIDRGRLATMARETSAAIGLRRPVVLLRSDHSGLLVTWGVLRPKVILPAAADDWSDDRARVVLRHELAHVRRGDWAALMAAEMLRAVYWFNPLVWIVCQRVRQESEYACDDAVLNAGVEGAEYATHLLDLARALTAGRRRSFSAFPAPAMARPSNLEGRVRAMLNANVNRAPLTRRVRFATILTLLSLTVTIAGLGAQSFFTFSGALVDATNRSLPGAKLVLTNASRQATHEIRSDRTGRFEFVGLPPGDYALEVSIPGFSTFSDQLTVSGGNVDRTIELKVGSLEETITVTASRSTPGPADSGHTAEQASRIQQARVRAEARQRATLDKCAATPASPMGGQILAPMRLNSANPRYPDNLRAAGIQGIVKMEALIGTDGNIQDVRAIESPHPDLESAAIDAVRQWQYTPTLLNCVPIEVRMMVTTRFTSQP